MSALDRLSNFQSKPIWAGPESSAKDGGVTQSLLGKYLACPSRFKALVIEGLKPRDRFSHRLFYGNMFHVCDEAYRGGGIDWGVGLRNYVEFLCTKYPYDQEEIQKWHRVCAIQFPVYLDYWFSHDNSTRTPLLQEEAFQVPYKLPSGRVVYLRGRWDAVELGEEGIWLVESKTKGDVDPIKIERRLKYDLQTQLYLIALREFKKEVSARPIEKAGGEKFVYLAQNPICGVRYNVVRRPLSGGKGTIKQTKNETVDEYYARLQKYISDEPETYFFRWQSEVSTEDIEAFEKNTLIPCLERLCYWWDGINGISRESKFERHWSNLHFTMPFGVPHITDEYGSDYDEYVMTGNTIGLETCKEIFPELNG